MGKVFKPRAFYPLKDVFKAIDKGNIDIENLYDRDTNKDTLNELGLTIPEAVQHIRRLRDSQFEETSHLPGQPPADVYKKTINKMTVYIKFFLEGDLVVLSFHKDEPRR